MEADSNTIPAYSPVCMIYSQLSLKELEELFQHFGDNGSEHGPLRIVRAKDDSGHWRDTNRTIILVSKRLYDRLMDEGLYKSVRSPGRPVYDFRIVPYEIRDNNLPKEGMKKDLFIRIPNSLEMSSGDVESIIKDKMADLVKFRVISEDQFSVKIPLRNKDRSSGVVHGSCFLAFADSVSNHQAALVKAVIDDTFWGEHDETFNCYWAREQKEKASAPSKASSESWDGPEGEEVKAVGLDKNGKKAFLKSDIVSYKHVPVGGKKKVAAKKFPKKQQQ